MEITLMSQVQYVSETLLVEPALAHQAVKPDSFGRLHLITKSLEVAIRTTPTIQTTTQTLRAAQA